LSPPELPAEIGIEAAEALSAYLRIDTSNPPGNESAGARYLAMLLRRDGIASELREHAPGRASLLACLPGTGRGPPVGLVSHIDVATADPSTWNSGHGPFSGDVAGGSVWGRGALDMKGMGIVELLALAWLKRSGAMLDRDVWLIAVADEEVGNRGMAFVADRVRGLGLSHAVNEGGIGLVGLVRPGRTVYSISVAEKGALWLRLTATGRPGHGSIPLPGEAPARLLAALDRLGRRFARPKLHPALAEWIAAVGRGLGGPGRLLALPGVSEFLAPWPLLLHPLTRAAVTDTVHVTGFSTGVHEPNVVPAEASAILDCRLLPGSSPEALRAEVEALVGLGPGIRIEELHRVNASESPWDDPFYDVLARHVSAGRPDVDVGPIVSVGSTDSVTLREMGVRTYGLIPFEIPVEEAATMHGPDERVSIANLDRGVRVLYGVLLECGGLPPL
jgi:acetylornithine deacetylase/succinyl-diaminopimelate desuccinylase-like protein